LMSMNLFWAITCRDGEVFLIIVLETYIKRGTWRCLICFNYCTFQCFSARKSANLGLFKREYNPYHWRVKRAQSKWHGMLYSVLGLLQRCVPDRVSRNKRAVSDSALCYQKPLRLFLLRNAGNTGASWFSVLACRVILSIFADIALWTVLLLMKNTAPDHLRIWWMRYLYQRMRY
jgi:hypothetical protein